MVIDNVLINKSRSLERCIARVKEEYAGGQVNLFENITKQDSIILNLQRACEICIDLGTYVLKKKNLGIPQSSRDTFEILAQAKLIESDLLQTMKNMVGFRNVAIHEYQKLSLEIVKAIIENKLDRLAEFTACMKKALNA